MKENNNVSKNYHMATCQLEVLAEGNVFSATVNAMIAVEENRIGAKDLKRIQELACLHYVEQLKQRGLDPSRTKFVDVVILNIVNLGSYTKEEWDASMPEFAKAQASNDEG